MTRFLSLFLFLCLQLTAFPVKAVINESTSLGVDDWNASDISLFFQKNCPLLALPPDKVNQMSMEVSHLFEGKLLSERGNEMLDLMGLQDEEIASMKEALLRLNHQLTASPQDLYEWRLANRRMFGWLQIMLGGSPRLLLLYLKYFHHDMNNRAYYHGASYNMKDIIKKKDEAVGSPNLQLFEPHNIEEEKLMLSLNLDTKSNALNEVVHEVLSTKHEVQFWFEWVFFPQLPFYAAIKNLDFQHSYLDEIVKFMIIFRFAINAVEVYALTITYNFAAFTVGNVIYECGNFLAAGLYYHVLWFILPEHLHDLLFYFSIFVLIPNFTFYSIFSLISMMESQLEKSYQNQVERSVRNELHED